MKYLLPCISALLCYSYANSQDIIIKRNGDEIKAKVSEITETTVKYKKWENIDGPLYNINKLEVFKVKYETGQSDFFGNVTETNTTAAPTPPQPSATTQKKNQATSTVVVAEVSKRYPQPPATNIPYWYDEGRNALIELEKVTYKTETVHSGLWGKHNLMILPGPFSNVQITKKQEPRFIIQLDKDAEPYSSCLLNTSEVNDAIKRREWVMSTKGMHSTETQHDAVQIEFEKIGDGLYLITLNKKLKPGELFFWVSEASQVYAFGYSK
jgi:hypothetical protein